MVEGGYREKLGSGRVCKTDLSSRRSSSESEGHMRAILESHSTNSNALGLGRFCLGFGHHSLGLGSGSDRNTWPDPYSTTEWESRDCERRVGDSDEETERGDSDSELCLLTCSILSHNLHSDDTMSRIYYTVYPLGSVVFTAHNHSLQCTVEVLSSLVMSCKSMLRSWDWDN